MRAAVFEEFGEPWDVLQVRDVPDPQPRAGEVLVRMLASPVNPSDLMTVRGTYTRRPELPAVPGYEGVGVVESSGAGLLGKFLAGRRVAVLNPEGGDWAERVVIPAKQAIPLSSNLTVEQGATFFVNPATAYAMTREVLQVPPGAWLLQTAAGSTLGRMVVRLGDEFGFKTLNIVRREAQVEELRALGADEVVVFDGAKQEAAELVEAVRGITGGGVRFAIDPVAGRTGSAAVECLGENGRLLVFGTLSNEPLSFTPRTLMKHGARVEGFWLSNLMAGKGLLGKLRLVRRLTALIKEGVLVSEPGESFPLEEVGAAARAAERPGHSGKILLRLGEA